MNEEKLSSTTHAKGLPKEHHTFRNHTLEFNFKNSYLSSIALSKLLQSTGTSLLHLLSLPDVAIPEYTLDVLGLDP
jgi:hypothetical protein